MVGKGMWRAVLLSAFVLCGTAQGKEPFPTTPRDGGWDVEFAPVGVQTRTEEGGTFVVDVDYPGGTLVTLVYPDESVHQARQRPQLYKISFQAKGSWPELMSTTGLEWMSVLVYGSWTRTIIFKTVDYPKWQGGRRQHGTQDGITASEDGTVMYVGTYPDGTFSHFITGDDAGDPYLIGDNLFIRSDKFYFLLDMKDFTLKLSHQAPVEVEAIPLKG